MDAKTIKEKKQNVEKKFDDVKKQRELFVEQGKELQVKIAQADDEMKRLQGEFRLLEELSKPSEEPKKDEKK